MIDEQKPTDELEPSPTATENPETTHPETTKTMVNESTNSPENNPSENKRSNEEEQELSLQDLELEEEEEAQDSEKSPVSPKAEGDGLPVEVQSLIESLKAEVEQLKQKLAKQAEQGDGYKAQYMRIAADFDNFRKRTQLEKEELELQVKRKTLAELLPVVDNFERARSQLKPANEGEMVIHKSYQSVYKNLVDGLKRLGVSAMRPEGKEFDPNYHEAMFREQTHEYPEGAVIEQLVRGYLLNDIVLRHAMVKVAAPPDDEPAPTPPEAESEPENSPDSENPN